MAKEAANLLLDMATAAQIRFPKTMEAKKDLLQICASTLLSLPKLDDDGYDVVNALAMLEEKFGKIEEAGNKRKNDSGEASASSPAEKKKKTEDIAVEENRSVAGAIKEMADIYFQNGDRMKGGVYSKAAKAIREATFQITSGKEAAKLKGIGKGIAGMIDEFIAKGMIVKLEEMRSGMA
jgi:hypothetical protein